MAGFHQNEICTFVRSHGRTNHERHNEGRTKKKFSLDSEFIGSRSNMLEKKKLDCGIFINFNLLNPFRNFNVLLSCWKPLFQKFRTEINQVDENAFYLFCKTVNLTVSFTLRCHLNSFLCLFIVAYRACLYHICMRNVQSPIQAYTSTLQTIKLLLCVDVQL